MMRKIWLLVCICIHLGAANTPARVPPSEDPHLLSLHCADLLEHGRPVDQAWGAYWVAQYQLAACEPSLFGLLEQLAAHPPTTDRERAINGRRRDHALQALFVIGASLALPDQRDLIPDPSWRTLLWLRNAELSQLELELALLEPSAQPGSLPWVAIMNRLLEDYPAAAAYPLAPHLTLRMQLTIIDDENQPTLSGSFGSRSGGGRWRSGFQDWPPQRLYHFTLHHSASMNAGLIVVSDGPYAVIGTLRTASIRRQPRPIAADHYATLALHRLVELARYHIDGEPMPELSWPLATWLQSRTSNTIGMRQYPTADAQTNRVTDLVAAFRAPWIDYWNILIAAGWLEAGASPPLVRITVVDERSQPDPPLTWTTPEHWAIPSTVLAASSAD